MKAANLTDELDERHLCRITLPVPEFEHSGVATRTLHVPRSDLVEQLAENLSILDLHGRQSARVNVTATRQRDARQLPLEVKYSDLILKKPRRSLF